jgi:hypothetical protein
MKIVNRSQWPTWALKVLCRWVAARSDVPRRYTFTFRSTSRGGWRGTGAKFWQTIRLARRYRPAKGWPMTSRYYTAGKTRSNFPEVTHRTNLELLVGLMCHEARHSTTHDEFLCEVAEVKGLEAFRLEWPIIRQRLKEARREHQALRQRHHEKRSDPSPKLESSMKLLAMWQRKAKLARTKIKKYERLIRYYSGKVAAKVGP